MKNITLYDLIWSNHLIPVWSNMILLWSNMMWRIWLWNDDVAPNCLNHKILCGGSTIEYVMKEADVWWANTSHTLERIMNNTENHRTIGFWWFMLQFSVNKTHQIASTVPPEQRMGQRRQPPRPAVVHGLRPGDETELGTRKSICQGFGSN